MGTRAHTKAPRRPRFAMRLKEEDRKILDELRAWLRNDAGEPSYADVVRLALRESLSNRIARKDATPQ